MKLIQKITGSLLTIGMLTIIFAPTAYAQSAFDNSVLDDIKGKLEGEGIAVVDYSTPEGSWGSIPSEWQSYFIAVSIPNIAEIANRLEDLYIGDTGLTALRRELARFESEKTVLTIQSEIDDKENAIKLSKLTIKLAEDDIRDAIVSDPLSVVKQYNKDHFTFLEVNDTIINLVFHEVDFYFNYNKWGRLPTRIIKILEEAREDDPYESLDKIVEEVGLENLESMLSGMIDMNSKPRLSADDVDLIIDSVGLLSKSGERQITEVTRAVVNTIKNLIAGIAVIWIVYAGARMMFAQGDENVITEQKRSIIYGLIGLVTILLAGRGIDYLYGPAGAIRTELTADQGFTNEIYGLVLFIKALIGTIAILFIIVSGGKMLFAAGEEQEISKQKKSLLWIGIGLILIAIDQIIVEQIFIIPTQQSDQIKSNNIVSLINTVGSVFQFLLGFVGLIAFGALIYGAATMIMNYGNDEMVEKSKKIIKNAIIGILVILSAYTIVATLVVFK